MALSILGGFAGWEFVGRFVVTDRILFAPLSEVLLVGWKMAVKGELLPHIATSSLEFILGFLLAASVGIMIGVVMALNRMTQNVLDPWISFLYSSPLVALMPFFILIFGVGIGSKIAIVFTVSVFPIILNTFVGIKSTDEHLLEVARAFLCTPLQVFRKVLLPSALPFIVVGLRLGVGRALTGVVVGELFAANQGLGYVIATAGQSFDTPTLFFGVLVFSVIGVVLMEVLKASERRLAPWRVRNEAI